MKLSMWMIANRLTSFDLELHIKNDAKQVLKSARQVYANDCAVVTARGSNVICYDASDVANQIIIKNMSITQGMELVQSVFDFYQDWIDEIKQQLKDFNYQKVIDLSWNVFHNPILLFNGNHRILAMSRHYTDEEMGIEWSYLKEFGYPSMEHFQVMRSNNMLRDVEYAQLFAFTKNDSSNAMSSPIRFRDKICGRLIVLEKDRKFNQGDVELLNILVNELRLPLAEQKSEDQTLSEINFDCLGNLLDGTGTNIQSLTFLLSYMQWNINDYYKVYKIKIQESQETLTVKERFFLETLRRNTLGCAVLKKEKGGELYIIHNLHQSPESAVKERLLNLAQYNRFFLTESLEFQGIYHLNFLREQADYAMDLIHIYHYDPDMLAEHLPCISFYNCAIEYLITSGNLGKSMYALHPDILRLWRERCRDKDHKLDTYICYLENGRSLKKAAEHLHLHRNTLVYRINKIQESLHYHSDDLYTMDYIRLSIRILYILEKRGFPLNI